MLEKFPDVLTVKQVAEILSIGVNAAYRIVNSGDIKSIRIGKTIRVPKVCMEDYLTSGHISDR